MDSLPAYRFALQVRGSATGAAWLDEARKAESDGWDAVTLPDHLDEQFAPLVALGSVAAVTRRVRLGTFVLAAAWRHVGMLAKEAATLDVVSDGRLELGIGGGWNPAEFAALGLPFDSAAARVAVVEETVAALRALWRGETVDLPGPVFSGTGLRCWPLPVQPGGPRLVIGGGAPRMLGVAARLADIVSVVPSAAGRTDGRVLAGGLDRPSMQRQVAWVREAAAGRPVQPELNLRVLGVAAGRDPLDGARLLAEQRNSGTPQALVGSPFLLLGRPQDMVEQMARNREELGLAYYTVSARDLPDAGEAIDLVRASR
jgi:probable F420-dependent oxidoreductase